jgi:hypothetical protein
MHDHPKAVVTIIADSRFVLPVYVLVLSLKFFQPEQRIHILGISLSETEKAFFTQFEKVFVFDSSIPRSDKPGAMRIIADILKGEALLTAKDCDEPWIALLDGDCIATGDLSPYLQPTEPAFYARSRSKAEDTGIFRDYRRPDDPNDGIPEHFLNRWRKDVGQRETPAYRTTILSGNLVLHRRYLDFANTWGTFMKRVLVPDAPEKTDTAYYMPAEFALSAWMMFAYNPPPLRNVLLNSNPQAYLAHLGPSPKYWRLWTRKNLRHFDSVMQLLDWAHERKYAIPLLPYTLKKRNKKVIVFLAFTYEIIKTTGRKLKQIFRQGHRNIQHVIRDSGRQTGNRI